MSTAQAVGGSEDANTSSSSLGVVVVASDEIINEKDPTLPASQDAPAAEGSEQGLPADEGGASIDDDNERVCRANHTKEFYINNSRSFKVLAVMSIGLKDENNAVLLDINQSPWNSMKSADRKPTKVNLANEIQRRTTAYSWKPQDNFKMPKPKKWSVGDCMKWLTEHPIDWVKDGINDCELDVEFVKQEIARRRMSLQAAAAEKEAEASELEGRWTGRLPLLRLIHCLIEFDDIRAAYIKRNIALNKDELENNKSDIREKTVWEQMSEKWNDPDFNPSTVILRDVPGQDEFLVEIPLRYAESFAHLSAATPKKCQDRFDEMGIALKRQILSWERSGQGARRGWDDGWYG